MTAEYPSNVMMIAVLRTSVAKPVLDGMIAEAKTSGRPLRKVVGGLLEQAWAEKVVREAVASGELKLRPDLRYPSDTHRSKDGDTDPHW